jgi:hypothetical protein
MNGGLRTEGSESHARGAYPFLACGSRACAGRKCAHSEIWATQLGGTKRPFAAFALGPAAGLRQMETHK